MPDNETKKRKKILLVDDSSTALMMEKMILRGSPYDLVVANNGQAAVDTALRERPDLILMDVIMPRMTGFEACRILRGMENMGTIPIIMVTTRGEPENVEVGFASGCTDYVTKPIDATELLTKLKSYLGD